MVVTKLIILSLLSSLLVGPAASQFLDSLYGVNYSLRIGPDWTSGAERCKSVDRIQAELSILKEQITDNVRVFSMTDCDTAAIMLSLTKDFGMGLWLGVWVGPDDSIFENERARLLQLLQSPSDFSNVLGIHVSSEAIYREEITADKALELHFAIQDDMATAGLQEIPVTISDIIDTNLQFPQLIKADPNVVTFNMFPFWERSVNINNAAQYMADRVKFIEDQAEGRQIIITETGWADAGSNKDANIANPQSMGKWLRDFACLANERGWKYFWFTSFDSDWRRLNEQTPDDVEGHFGLYDEAGMIKDHIRNLVLDCSLERVDISLAASGTPNPTSQLGPSPTTSSPVTPGPTTSPATPAPTPVLIADIFPTTMPVTPGPTVVVVDSFATSNPTPAVIVDSFPVTSPPSSVVTPFPTQSVSSIFSPTASSSQDPQCSANVLCQVRGLTGNCCPTDDGVDLDCCGSIVVETCFNNPQCDVLGLAGACCPTKDKITFLDCCESVPDICLDATNTDCVVYSALQYKADIEAEARSGAKGYKVPSRLLAFGLLGALGLLY